MKNFILVISTCIIFICDVIAQKQEVVESEVKEAKVQLLGKSRKIIDLIPLESTSKVKKAINSLQKKAPENFIGRRGRSKVVIPELEHRGPDRVRQNGFSEQAREAIEPKVNIQGLGFSSPLDPTGDIGEDYYLQAVNVTEVGVYDKSGNMVSQFSMNTLWSEFNVLSEGDPIILYDEIEGRWILTEFTDPANLLIAISDTEDPLGTYNAYSFSTLNFPDYPKFGIWPNALVVTTNEQAAGQLTSYFIERTPLMNGDNSVTMQRINVTGNNNTEAGFYVATPIDWNGTQMPLDEKPLTIALNDSSWGGTTDDVVSLFQYDIDWDDADNTQVTRTDIELSPFDSYPCSVPGIGFSCIPQLGGDGVDGIPEVIMNIPHYRRFGNHESIVFNFITDATNGNNIAGIRWVELRSTTGNNWAVHQEGTFAPDDNLHRFMGSIAMDEKGNIGLAYNVSSENDYIGIRFTGRLLNDPLGEMTFEEYVVAEGENAIFAGSRFGDYADMKLDASDGRTFWYTTEYAAQGATRSRIIAFELNQDSIDLGVSVIIDPSTSSTLTSNELVTIEIVNNGFTAVSIYETGFFINDQLIESITLTNTIAPDESFVHTFTTPFDMSTLGSYEIRAFVNTPSDQNLNNNSIIKVVKQIRGLDAEIIADDIPLSCGDDVLVPLLIRNNGEADLTEVVLEAIVNGSNTQTFTYNGLISFDQTQNFDILLTGLTTGENTINVEIVSINGSQDGFAINNVITETIEKFDSDGQVTLAINFDQFPAETTWELYEQGSGVLIAQGGPYQTDEISLEEVFCLNPDFCYSFTINDSASDGICCGWGNGDYALSTLNGIIFQGDGQFGSNETTEFCPMDKVLPNIDAGIDVGIIPVVCAEDISIPIQIINLGTDDLTQLLLGFSVNGGSQSQAMWSGNLGFMEEELFTLNVQDLEFGNNELVVEILTANGNADNQINNNGIMVDLNYIQESSTLNLVINFDQYPNETSWTISSQTDGSIYYAGGPYTGATNNLNESFCLDPDECYVFTISDANGDGICCSFGKGSYQLIDDDKNIIFNGIGDFEDQEVVEFCGDFTNIESALETSKTPKIVISPNPNNGSFLIDIINTNLKDSQLDIEIFSIDGKLVQHRRIGRFNSSYQGQISLVAWPDGVYIIKANVNGRLIQSKVVKQ